MPLLRDDDLTSEAWHAALGVKAGPGGYGSGAGGPTFSDAFRSRRSPSKYELVEAYKGLSYACATLNAHAVARQPLRLYASTGRGQSRPKCHTAKRDGRLRARVRKMAGQSKYAGWFAKSEEVDEVAEHPLLEALDAPNPDFDRSMLIRYTVLAADITGSWYWQPEPKGAGKLDIWPLLSQYVQPYRSGAGSTVDGYFYFDRRFEPTELIRGRHLSPRDPYMQGYGPMQAAFEYVRLVDQFVSVRDSILSSPRPAMIVSAKDEKMAPGKVERQRFEDDINRRMGGGNVGRAFVTDGAWDFTPFSHSLADLGAAGVDDTGLEGVAYCFGVPVSLLKTRDVNKANAEAGHRQHAEMAVEPRCTAMASALTKWTHAQDRALPTGRPLGWGRLFWAFDDPVSEDRELDAKVFDMKLKAGVTTINEVRAEDGYDAVEWGDEPWLSNTLVQPSTAKEMRDRAAEQAEAADAKPVEPGVQPDADEAAEESEQEQEGGAKSKAFTSPDDDARHMLMDAAASLGLAREARDGTLTPAQRRDLCHAVSLLAARRLGDLAAGLAADLMPHDAEKGLARIAADRVAAFFKAARRTIGTAALAATLALKGPGELSPTSRTHLAAGVVKQEAYLDKFQAAVMDESQPPDGTLASRAEMYGQAAWSVAHEVERADAIDSGMTEEQRVMGAAESHCYICPQLADRGWVPIDTLPGIGQTPCLTNCRCWFEYR